MVVQYLLCRIVLLLHFEVVQCCGHHVKFNFFMLMLVIFRLVGLLDREPFARGSQLFE